MNAALANEGISYSRFIAGLKAAGIELDRKVLAYMAMEDPAGFSAVAQAAKAAQPVPLAAAG